jgi:phosphoadenosine phosphosulfate reductase
MKTVADPDELHLGAWNRKLRQWSAPERLEWSMQVFDRNALVATSSFQTQSVPLLHLISRAAPELTIVFLDTGFHFPETLQFRDRLADEFDLEVRSVTNELGHEEFRRKHGALYRSDPDLCCYMNKVEPLERVLEPKQGWVTGIRRDQTEARRNADILQTSDKGDGTLKICPIVDWSADDVAEYRDTHDLPEHPLTSEGYTSIGCAPCTQCPGDDADDERAGRWADSDKTECGLHIENDDDSEPDDLPESIEVDND